MENKIICQLCKRELTTMLALKMHMVKSHPQQSAEEYYDKYLMKEESNICVCGKKRKFYNISKGYTLSCGSNSCASKINFQKLRDLGPEEYKKEIDKRTAKSQEKQLGKYGCVSYTQTDEYIEKTKKKHIENCGYEWYTQSPKYREELLKISQENYGVDHHLMAPEVIQARRDTVRKDYGVDNVFQVESIKATIKETWEENYPEGNPNRNKAVRDKIEGTSLKRYGVKCYLSLNPNKEQQRKSLLIMKLKIILERIENKYNPLFTSEEYEGTAFLYKWECKRCKNEFEDYIQNGHPHCPKCYPRQFGGSSVGEKEVAYFLENHTSILTNKKFKKENSDKKFEIDILLPDKNIGIEYNGIRYHAEIFGGKDKDFHLTKTNECIKQGIQLIHIFEHEWLQKPGIIKEVSSKDSQQFLELNHIQGSILGSIRIGLYYGDILVSLMTFSKSRFNKNYDYELLRFCNGLNTSVTGGFAKLLKYFKNNYQGSLISYADRRFSNGGIYEKNNFNLLHISPPSYYYVSSKGLVQNRINFQKHKLKSILPIFDDKLSEWENMKLNGYDRFWDCGNLVYELK